MSEVGNVQGSVGRNSPRPVTPGAAAPSTLACGDAVSVLRAISGVAEALTRAGTLQELAATAVTRMRESLGLAIAAVHVADGVPPVAGSRDAAGLVGVATDADIQTPLTVDPYLTLDPEAWSLMAAARGPMLFGGAADSVISNPFQPPATSWLVLPLQAEGAIVGVVVAADHEPIVLDAAGVMLLSSLGNILSAGITTARVRLQLEHGAARRERSRIAAELHDGLAQDLALAKTEIARLDELTLSRVPDDSWQRLRQSVDEANRSVRANLEDLSEAIPAAELGAALKEVRARFAARGLAVSLEIQHPCPDVPADLLPTVVGVVREALTNVRRHAGSTAARVRVSADDAGLRVEIVDFGVGLPAAPDGPAQGHYGMSIMREQARHARGTLDVARVPRGGTKVTLSIPTQRAGQRLP